MVQFLTKDDLDLMGSAEHVIKFKPIALNVRIESLLINMTGTTTYKALGELFGTHPRAIGSCMRVIGKRNPELSKKVKYSSI